MRSPSRDSNRVHSSPSQSVEEGCGGVDGDAPTTWTASLSRKRLVLAPAGFLRIVLPFLPPLVLSPLRPQLRQLRPLLGCQNAPHLEHHHRARLPEPGACLLQDVYLIENLLVVDLVGNQHCVEILASLLDVRLQVLELVLIAGEDAIEVPHFVVRQVKLLPDVRLLPELPVVHGAAPVRSAEG